MERVSLIRAAVGAAVLVAAPGCISPQKPDGTPKAGANAPAPQAGPVLTHNISTGLPGAGASQQGFDGQVKQASASLPAFKMPALATSAGKDKPGGQQAAIVAVGWRKRVEYLPDPTKNGAMGPGLVGEMFLLAGNGQFVTPDGSVTVELFDETPRPGTDPRRPPKLEQWRFDKDVLRQLTMPHEWFGKCYALFLPWPGYRPDIAKVRLMVKYEPEQGFPIYAEPVTLVIDNSTSPGQPSFGPVASPSPMAGFGTGIPMPPNPGLPPIGITRPPGQ